MEQEERNKMQKLAGVQKEPAKLTHYKIYNGQKICKYSDGSIRVDGVEFPTERAAARYIDYIGK